MLRLWWLRPLVGLAFLGLIFSQIGLSQALDELSQAKLGPFLVALLLNVTILGLVAMRSAILLRRFGHHVPLGVLSLTSTVGYVIGALTPAAAGEVLRIQTLSSRGGVPARVSVMLVAVERMLSFYLLCLCAAVAAAWALAPWGVGLVVTFVAIPLAALPLLGSPIMQLMPQADEEASSFWLRSYRRIYGMAADSAKVLGDPLSFATISIFSIAIFSLVAAQFWFLAMAVNSNVAFHEAWAAFGISQVAGVASMLPFGLGASDGSLTAVLGSLGTGVEAALAVAILVRLAITLPLLVVASAAYGYLLLPVRFPGFGHLSPEKS
jgi:uncharacterized protein (TIRG00374 family)